MRGHLEAFFGPRLKRKTPEGFPLALKAPRVLTHDKVLADCQEDLAAFIRVADRPEDQLGLTAQIQEEHPSVLAR